MRTSLALLLVALSGCATTIDADDYERSCQEDSECMIISVGDVCDCSCDVSAINRSDEAAYRNDRDVTCSKQCEPCPETPPAICAASLCQVAP